MPTNPFCSTPPPLNLYKKGEFYMISGLDGVNDLLVEKILFDVISIDTYSDI